MKDQHEPNVRKEQVLDLLKSLQGFYDLPREGLDLSHTLAANAKRAQLEAERRFGSLLSNDVHGISALSQLLTSMHRVMKPNRLRHLLGAKISFEDSVLVANTFGAFLGEVMRQELGGEWKYVDFQGQRLLALYSNEQNWSLPTYKAGKQFMNGEEDDVMFFYQVFIGKRAASVPNDALVVTQADIAKGQEHLAQLVARHEEEKKNRGPQ
jgi:hypothetical protein